MFLLSWLILLPVLLIDTKFIFYIIQKRLGVDFETDELEYPFEQIPKLIRLLNRTENHEKRLLICEHIRSVVYQSSK